VWGGLFLSGSKFFPFPYREIPSLEIPKRLDFFSDHEFIVFQAIAERMIGAPSEGNPSAALLNITMRADKFLSGTDPEVQEQFHQLLTVFNAPFFAFLFDFRFSSFISMSAEDQDSYIEDWMTSTFAFRRTGFQALKRVCLIMFYTEPRSWPEIGYDGKFEPA